MPVRPALAVRPIRCVYDLELVGRSKFMTHATFLKSIPLDTPYSLSFLAPFNFFFGGFFFSIKLASVDLCDFFLIHCSHFPLDVDAIAAEEPMAEMLAQSDELPIDELPVREHQRVAAPDSESAPEQSGMLARALARAATEGEPEAVPPSEVWPQGANALPVEPAVPLAARPQSWSKKRNLPPSADGRTSIA